MPVCLNIIKMKKNRVRTCQNLGTAVKAQCLLKKREQEYSRLKRLYMDEVIERKKTERRLEIEKAISCYLHDSKEAVIIELGRAENDSTITRHIKEKLRAFEAYALKRMEAKIKAI